MRQVFLINLNNELLNMLYVQALTLLTALKLLCLLAEWSLPGIRFSSGFVCFIEFIIIIIIILLIITIPQQY